MVKSTKLNTYIKWAGVNICAALRPVQQVWQTERPERVWRAKLRGYAGLQRAEEFHTSPGIGKRGVFFTIAALLLISIAVFTVISVPGDNSADDAVEIRIMILDNFFSELNKDMERAVYIASFRAVFSLVQHTITTGTYIDDTESAFLSAVMNGTYKNQSLPIMEGSTLNDWYSRLKNHTNRTGMALEITFLNVSINHIDPWTVEASAEAFVSVEDKNGLASFKGTRNAAARVGIIGFEDPTYPLNTFGRATNIINRTPYQIFVQGADVSVLLAHTQKGYYMAHSDAPSFLMRLEGNSSSSPYGIESLVDVSKLTAQGLSAKSKTVVDYLYFSNQTTSDYRIQGTPIWFMLDLEHIPTYDAGSVVG